jgi:tetratricopeptide (TPR) repeat protein
LEIRRTAIAVRSPCRRNIGNCTPSPELFVLQVVRGGGGNPKSETCDRATITANLGNVARDQGDYASARVLYAESLAINRELGDAWQLAYLVEDIGVLAALDAMFLRALRLLGAADALREAISAPRSPNEQAALDRYLTPAVSALTEVDREDARRAGRAMPLDQALDYAGSFSDAP